MCVQLTENQQNNDRSKLPNNHWRVIVTTFPLGAIYKAVKL